MNEQKHWNTIANSYNEEIFDVFASDQKKILQKYFRKHAKKKGIAVDFGCGNGKAFPFLAPRFKEVIGADISENLLKDAAARGYKNVQVAHRDLSKPARLPKADFVFSCNVIMLPDAEANHRMFANIADLLKPKASAVLVVPSTESMLFTSWMLTELYRKDGVKTKDIDPEEFDYFQGERHEIASGVFYINDVPTRHYTSLELEVIAKTYGMKITALERVEYDWTSELGDPPKSLTSPHPFDWLVECRLK